MLLMQDSPGIAFHGVHYPTGSDGVVFAPRAHGDALVADVHSPRGNGAVPAPFPHARVIVLPLHPLNGSPPHGW